jgi:hypothetical protein
LSRFSDCLGSLQSGRQFFCLCQSVGCPGSPVVTIGIVAHRFCHIIVLRAALSGRCAPSRYHRISWVGGYLRLADKTAWDASQRPMLEAGTSCGNALDLHARLAFETTRQRHLARRLAGCLRIGQQMPPVEFGGSAILSVTGNGQGRAMMVHFAPFAAGNAGRYCSLSKN